MMSSTPRVPSHTSGPDQTTNPITLLAEHRTLISPYLPSHAFSQIASSISSSQPTNDPPLPHLTLTYATSLDAQISLGPNIETVISGPETKGMTHYLRITHDTILVGVGTAEIDDPGLNSRLEEFEPQHLINHEDCALRGGKTNPGRQTGTWKRVGLEKQPIPIILDPTARWSCRPSSKILTHAREGRGRGPIWIIDSCNYQDGISARLDEIKSVHGDLIVVPDLIRESRDDDGVSRTAGIYWERLLMALAMHKEGIRSVMVEGGAKVIMDLLRGENQKFVRSVIVTVAPVWLGSGGVAVVPRRKSETQETSRLVDVRWCPMGQDVVMCGRFSLTT